MRNWISRFIPIRDEPRTDEPARATLSFADVEGALALYVTALSGGTLRVTSSSSATHGSYTDGRTIFFPPQIDLFEDLTDARRLYRVMAAWKVLQVRTGSLEIEYLPESDNPGVALALYEVIHGEWLDRHLASLWPGLAQDLAPLRYDALHRRTSGMALNGSAPEALLRGLLALPLDQPPSVDGLGAALAPLEEHGVEIARLLQTLPRVLTASAPNESLDLARELSALIPPSGEAPAAVHYRGRIRPDLLRRPTFVYDDDEEMTARAASGPPRTQPRAEPIHVEARSAEQRVPRQRRASRGGRQAVQLSLGDREPSFTFQQVPLTDAEKAGAFLYDEWDSRRNEYLREWCAVRQRRPKGGNPEPVERILRQNAALVTRLKQQFEALRPERVRLTRQFDGDDIDLGAVVEDHADRRAGFSPAEKLYSRTLERERNIALGCLVDLSGSTGAWIDDDPRNEQVVEITRRAMVFLCEALTVLDDRYAIFGFTGATRKNCEISVVKAFDESYGETVKGRIAGLAPGAYTRIGPAVRHTAHALTRQPARVRLLLLISDGRPNDFDGYGGRYGIEDTRRALIEARQQGVATFAITIDAEARDYMPYMFGRNHYVVVENAPALAVKLADIYRRLTLQ